MVTIVAEIASAHEGELEQMLLLVDAAKAANADAVKFQIYKADLLSVRRHPLYDLYNKLQYDANEWERVISYAHGLQLSVLAEVFDPWALQLATKCGVEGYKIHSTVFYEEELMAKIASCGKPIYLGVGGIPLAEIDNALKILRKSGAKKVILTHGFQSYPTRLEDTDLLRILTLKERFKLPVCFADHVDADSQLAVILPLVAIGYGADIIEKHLTLDRSKKGPDYYSSLNPDEFSSMVNSVRQVEKALGTGDFSSEAERSYLTSVVKKIVATEQIKGGDTITPKKIAFKRSAEEGLLPSDKQRILYKRAKKNIDEDETITVDKVEDINIGVLVAVRMKSTRLPQKAMIEIQGKTVIEHLLERVKAAKMPNVIVVCTSTHPDDAILIDVARKVGVKWFSGSEEDVMERFLQAARQEGVDIIIRVTGDCPLIDPEYIDKAAAHHIAKGADFTRVVGMPIGTGCELFSTKALEKAHTYAADPGYSEYMSWYFLNNPEVFHIEEIQCDGSVEHPDYRLTVDEIADIELMNEIYKCLYSEGEVFPLREVIKLLERNPALLDINKQVELKWRDDKELLDLLKDKTRLRRDVK